MNTDNLFSDRLNWLIMETGAKKNKLAELLGVSPAYITKLTGKELKEPSDSFIKLISRTFKISEEWLRGENVGVFGVLNNQSEFETKRTQLRMLYEELCELKNISNEFVKQDPQAGGGGVNLVNLTPNADIRGEIPPATGYLPVVSLAKGGNKGFFEDAYPVGHGFMQIVRPHDITDSTAYAVMITGTSMSPMYEEGDIVVASPSHPVMNGKPVVAKLVTGEVMVKRYRARNGNIILESVNPEEKDIVLKPEDILFTHRIVWKKEG